VVDAFLSPYVLLSSFANDGGGSARCIVMSLFLHYFFLAQFTAIIVQVTTTTVELQKACLLAELSVCLSVCLSQASIYQNG